MPLVDPVLVLADEADDEVALTQATRELVMLARRVGTPVLVRCEHCRAAEKLIDIARDQCPRAILITGSPANDQISAEVAVHLESAIVTDVTDLSIDHESLVAVSDRFASEIHTSTAVITVRPRIHEADRELVLTEADIVVAGGRGVGSAEGFSLLARVAYALGGCLGGTHTAGELGWCPRHARISLPGAQIRPRLYFAGGVSGSVRHQAAIRGARTVVAIDKDPDAPILRVADFGIVGDLHDVLPALLHELAARHAASPRDSGHQALQPIPSASDSSRDSGCQAVQPIPSASDSVRDGGRQAVQPIPSASDSVRDSGCQAVQPMPSVSDSSRDGGCQAVQPIPSVSELASAQELAEA